MMKELANWSRRHRPFPSGSGGSSVPSRLYTDEDPSTTIKGMGFKDAARAETTIRLSAQPGCVYKQYWTIKAMAERARHHPHPTAGIRAALGVFDRWLEARQTSSAFAPPPPREEREQRRVLAGSLANAHARSRCSSDAEHAALLAADRRAALTAIRGAGKAPFQLPSTAFVAVFGSPGEHGYGNHRCDGATAAGLAGWRCTCAFAKNHTVTVAAAAELSGGGASIPFPAFGLNVRFDGPTATATLRAKPARGQTSLTAFFRPKPTTNSMATAATAATAEAASRPSQQHLVESDGCAATATPTATAPAKTARLHSGRALPADALAPSSPLRLQTPPRASAAVVLPALWSCSACTFDNSHHEAACAICEAPRPITLENEAQQKKSKRLRLELL